MSIMKKYWGITGLAIIILIQPAFSVPRKMTVVMVTGEVTVEILIKGKRKSVSIPRTEWLQACKSRVTLIRKLLQRCFQDASVRPEAVDACVLLGPLMTIPDIPRSAVTRLLLYDHAPQRRREGTAQETVRWLRAGFSLQQSLLVVVI